MPPRRVKDVDYALVVSSGVEKRSFGKCCVHDCELQTHECRHTTEEYCTGQVTAWTEGADCSGACVDICPEE